MDFKIVIPVIISFVISVILAPVIAQVLRCQIAPVAQDKKHNNYQ